MTSFWIEPCPAFILFADAAMESLVDEYSEECAIALLGKPAPSLVVYEAIEKTGTGECFAVYTPGAAGPRLVGFAMLLAAIVPHWGLLCASVESIFVTREARSTGAGELLMRAIEKRARECGALAIFYCAPLGSSLEHLLISWSDLYEPTNTVFCRRLN